MQPFRVFSEDLSCCAVKNVLFLALFAFVFYVNSALSDFPREAFIDYIVADGERIRLTDGIDLSGKRWLNNDPPVSRYVRIGRWDTTLKNVNFSRSDLRNAVLRETNFENCDFSGTILMGAVFEGTVVGCNFTDARIHGASIGGLSAEQLKSTENYKAKNLAGTVFWYVPSDFSGVDFSGFDLTRTAFSRVLLNNSDFTDARIRGASFDGQNYHFIVLGEHHRKSDFGIEQLLTTRDFKEGFVDGVRASQLIWPEDKVVDLSRMVLVNSVLGSVNQAKVDLTDSVISSSDFRHFKGLTLENVKSTWNYKHRRMNGILLPPDIQTALDAERKK